VRKARGSSQRRRGGNGTRPRARSTWRVVVVVVEKASQRTSERIGRGVHHASFHHGKHKVLADCDCGYRPGILARPTRSSPASGLSG